MTESVEGGILEMVSRRGIHRGSNQFVVRSGERELSLKTQRSAQRQPVAAAARGPRIIA